MPLTANTRSQTSELVKTSVCTFRRNVQIPSDKLTSKIHFLLQSKRTCLLQTTTHFVSGKVITVYCLESSQTQRSICNVMQVERTHLVTYVLYLGFSKFSVRIPSYCRGYCCLMRPCKTKHLPQPDDSISAERESRAGYSNVLHNCLTNALHERLRYVFLTVQHVPPGL